MSIKKGFLKLGSLKTGVAQRAAFNLLKHT